jgi:hypothetical protein
MPSEHKLARHRKHKAQQRKELDITLAQDITVNRMHMSPEYKTGTMGLHAAQLVCDSEHVHSGAADKATLAGSKPRSRRCFSKSHGSNDWTNSTAAMYPTALSAAAGLLGQ